MDRNSSDSENGQLERHNESPSLSTRRKRRKTKGERDRLLKNRDQEKQDKKHSLPATGSKCKRKTKHKRLLTNLAIPIVRKNVSTITSNRLTRHIGLFDKMKASDTVLRDWSIPEHTVQKTSDDLQKILDLEDSGLRKPVDIQKLKSKRFKPTSIRVLSKDTELKEDKCSWKKKAETAKTKIHPVFSVSSESSMDLQEDNDAMDIDDARKEEDQFPKEPDLGAIAETMQAAIRAKNHFGERDLIKEICSRLRTVHKASSPSPSVEITPQQKIPTTAGSFSSEVVKRDSSQDHVEMSKSDSEMHARKHKPSSMQETSGSSNSKRRIQLNPSRRSGKRPPLEEQLPLTHTIPRITVDALSDAKYLLHLNDNPPKVYQEQNDRSLSNAVPGYMESRVKAHGIRRALAPLTNVYGSHPWAQQTDKSSIHPHRHRQMEHARRDVPVKYTSNCDTLGLHPFTRNVRITESFGGLHEPASFANQRQSNNVIATNQCFSRATAEAERDLSNLSCVQNVVAQYLYPVGYEHSRFRGLDDPFKCYEDPTYSYPSVSLSSQETCRSTDTCRSIRDDGRRYLKTDGAFSCQDGDQGQGDVVDLLDFANLPLSDHSIKSPDSLRRYSKPKPRTPTPPTIYPCRLYSRCDV